LLAFLSVNIYWFGQLVQPVSAATIPQWKWTWSLGTAGRTYLQALAADLNNDGRLEIVVVGGSEDYGNDGNVTVLNGATGAIIWSKRPYTGGSSPGIGAHTPFEIADLDLDGSPEIIVAARRGVLVYRANGDVYWRNPSALAEENYVAVGDANGDGYPEVFVCQGYVPTGRTDYITELSYDGRILRQAWNWHPCWGGLTIGDTNHDGILELYQGDRSVVYSGSDDLYFGGGMGVRALDAETLTPLWDDPTILCSSHAPILADVDKDGTEEVIVADQSASGIAVLNSADGTVNGGIRKGGTSMPAHSAPTVYDIDGDGNLELIDNRESQPKIFDLYNWQLEATLPITCNEPPKLGNVTGNGDGLLDIIAATGSDRVVAIYHYDTATHSYLNPFNLSRSDMLNANAFSLVADLDGDGLNELLFTGGNANGNVVCFDTTGKAPTPSVRSGIMFYGENRAGASVYVPSLTPTVPVLSNELPVSTAFDQALNPTLSIRAVDYQGNMGITFRNNASGTWQIIASYNNVGNSTYTANATGANSMNSYGTKYYWNVTATQGGSRASKLYSFTTLSQPPSGSSVLVSSGGTNGTKDNLICSNQSTTDPNGDKVSNVYDWSVNGNAVTDLNLAFDTRTSSNPMVSATSFSDGFESGLNNWNAYSSLTWSRVTTQKHSGSYSATTTSSTSSLISNNFDTSSFESMTVSFWYRKHGITDSNSVYLRFYNGTSYKYILNVETPLNFIRYAPDDTWLFFSIQTYDPQFLISNFRVRIESASIPSGGQLWIDDVSITTTTKTKDYSVYDNDATVHAATWTSDGVVGGAYVFDGKTSYLKIADDPTLGGNGTRSEISLEFWVKPLASQLGARIMMKHDPTESDASYMTGFNTAGTANTLFWGVITDYDNEYHEVYNSNTVLAAGSWYHVVCTYKSGTGLAIYINGTLRASSPVLGNIVAIGDSIFGQPLYIGYDGGTARSLTRFFNGVLDEVRIYERALSPMQVSQRYNETKGGVSSSETITWQETNLGDVWRCRITPNDGFGDGNTSNSTALTVSGVSPNNLPVASGLALSPIPVYGTNSLTGQYSYSDADGDPEWGTQIRWYKDGVLQPLLNDSPVVPVGAMSKNQVWNFTVRPRDGAGFGDLKWVAVTVSNSPPTFTSVYISPDPAMSTDTLKAIGVGWSDADGDAAGYLYQWQKRQTDGSWLNIAGQTAQTLGPSSFKSNDTVRVNCTAFDGQNTGVSLMETKWIANFSLPLASPLLVSSLGTNTTAEDLICYNVTGSQLTNIYNWNLNGSPWASLLMPFDTNSSSTAKDYSGNGNTGTVSGAAWTNQGVVGGAYSFSTDGETSGDVITVQDSATLGGDGTWTQITIEFWIKATSSQSGTRVLAKKIGNQPAGAYGSYTVEFRSGNALRFGVVLSPTSDLNATGTSYRVGSTATTTLVVGDWYHVVCTYKSGVGLAIYLNGTLRVSGAATGYIHPIGVEPLFIGFDGGTDLTRYFNGTLDELRIYTNAITAAQVLQRFMETADKSVRTETIVSEQLQAGQQWSCQVTPNTGSADGTAKFSNTVTIVAAPVVTQWKLTVEVSGSGTTNATGTAMYDSGAVVHVLASPSAGWSLIKWLLNGSDSGSANPYTLTMTANYNLTAIFTATQENAYLVVRGSSNEIFYRLRNSTSNSWSEWHVVPSGATIDSPAAALCSGKLYLVVRSTDGYSLWFGSVNVTDYSFSGWTWISGATQSAPTLTCNNTHLFLVVRGMDNGVYYRTYTIDTDTWGDWARIEGATCDRPSATVLEGKLHIVVRGFGTTYIYDNDTLWHGSINLTDNTFSGWTNLAGATPSAPSLTESATFGTLYLSVRGTDNTIYINKWTGANWQGWTALSSGATGDGPAAAVANDILHIVVRGMDGSNLWHYYIDLNTNAESGWAAISGSTPSAPSLC
jgi:hypothetical protein